MNIIKKGGILHKKTVEKDFSYINSYDNSKYDIEICCYVYKFQRRFWLMLSSIYNLESPPKILCTMNVHKEDPFRDWTLKLIDVFSKKINFRVREFSDKMFQFRSHTRNIDIEETLATYILFADGDLIFHKNFFDDIMNFNFQPDCLYGCPRFCFNGISRSNYILNNINYKNIIDTEKLVRGKKFKSRGIIGAGYFQWVTTKYIKDNIIKYTNKYNDQPLLETGEYETWSDITFRKQNFKEVKKYYNGLPIYHFDHYRARKGQKEEILNTKNPL